MLWDGAGQMALRPPTELEQVRKSGYITRTKQMKIFAYAVRPYDELAYFESFSKEYGFVFDYTSDYPSMDNTELARGYDAISIITNVMTEELLDKYKEMGIKYIATRSIGFEHMNAAYMKKLGLRGIHVSYSPNAVANYTIMMMLMACRKINYIMERAAVRDFTLNGKMGRELSLCTVGVIGTGRIGETVIRHLSGFGCRILAYDIYQKDSVNYSATSYRASCFSHHCLADTFWYRLQVLHGVHRRFDLASS